MSQILSIAIINREQYHQKLKDSCNFDIKKTERKQIFCEENYTFGLHMQEAIFEHKVLLTKKLFSIFVFCKNCSTMFKLLVILFIMKLYARNDIFKLADITFTSYESQSQTNTETFTRTFLGSLLTKKVYVYCI